MSSAMKALAIGVVLTATSCRTSQRAAPSSDPHEPPDMAIFEADLAVPGVVRDVPAPGRRARVTAPEYVGTEVHHLLYLPIDWAPGRTYPVIVEYAGNGPFRSRYGDVSTGEVAGSNLGYGISAGRGFIWLCLPFVNEAGTHNQRQWWGSVRRTVAYCKTEVRRVCAQFGGDPSRVILAGCSRGAIACNYIGLHDDEIAALWCGFICHSHYDGERRWRYEGSGRRAAGQRLARLGDRPQWISHELSVEATRGYLETAFPDGRFTLRALPLRNHTDAWVLREMPLRRDLRRWVRDVLATSR